MTRTGDPERGGPLHQLKLFAKRRFLGCRSLFLAILLFSLTAIASAQEPRAVSTFDEKGIVSSIKTGQIVVEHEGGDRVSYKVQDKDEEALSLEGGRFIFRAPAKIVVRGQLPFHLGEEGMVVTTRVPLNKFGRQESLVEKLTVLSTDTTRLGLRFEEEPTKDTYTECRVVGRILRASAKSVALELPKSKIAKRGRLTLKLDPEAILEIADDDLNRVQPGDRVSVLRGFKLSTGDSVVTEINVTMTAARKVATKTFHEKLEQKYSHLSDDPGSPRDVASEHFLLHTDISDRNAQILLEKLERMYLLVGQYYFKRPNDVIECFVVRDLNNWQRRLPRAGAMKIMEGAGVTLSLTRGNTVKSIVFSCDKHGVVQHEAVHAFCSQAFGTAGPVWYAEGMAEMGQYWRPEQREVDIDPVVIDYLSNAPKKSMREIVKAGQITGDSWRAYAWRWALCHLLANNPNYAKRFKELGLNLMSKQNDSFDIAFGKIADQISFEYDQFTRNIGNGYRVDLCTWDWSKKARKIGGSSRVLAKVKAQSGWQASGLKLQQGVSYDYVSDGTWKLGLGPETSAAGDEDGHGQLIGVIFTDYKLEHPIALSEKGTFVAPIDGHLFLRCRDDWTELSDNEGTIKVFFRRTPK